MPFSANGNQLTKLLPPGKLWLAEEGSGLQRTLLAMGDEFARVEARGAALVEETDPRTAAETIDDWERILALPDARVPVLSAVLAERRRAATQKWIARGGQSLAFYTALTAACGYPLVSITRYAPLTLRVGFRVQALTPTDASRVFGDIYAYAMLVTISAATAGALTVAQFEAVIRRATHSHISVVFTYT